jgi:hypothetical protein
MFYGPPVKDLTGAFYTSGDITPATLTGSVNDYDPPLGRNNTVWRLASDASRNITGIAGGVDGRRLTILNIGAFDIVLKDQDAASAAANRFELSADVTVGANTSAALIYDETSARWRLSAGAGGGGGGGAPTDAQYLVMAANATLTVERVATAGTGITITDGGAGAAATFKQTILLDQQIFADQMDVPDNADYAVNALAPTITKGGTDDDLKVAAFDATTQESRSFPIVIPVGGVNIEFEYMIAPASNPTAPNDQVELEIQTKKINSNAAPGAWSAAVTLGEQSLTAAATNLQRFTVSGTLASFNFVAGEAYNVSIRRDVSLADELPVDLYLWYVRVRVSS